MFRLTILLCLIYITEHMNIDQGEYGERADQLVCMAPFFSPPKCQFKCYCNQGMCEQDGDCLEHVRCQRGYFGAKCQYVDLAHRSFSSSYIVVDSDDSTCLLGSANAEIIISLQSNFVFSFIRLIVSNEAHLESILVSVESFGCPNKRGFHLSKKVIDVYCNVKVLFRNIRLTGDGVKWLCSVYVSGGRNVALRQWMTSSSPSLNLNYTVDSTIPTFSDSKEDKCFQTNTTPFFFNITFERTMVINRIVLYFKPGNVSEQTEHFVLTVVPPTGSVRFRFTATATEFKERLTYLLSPPTSAKTLMIMKTAVGVLRICEVEMYGDCPMGSYGLDCSGACPETCVSQLCSPVHGNCMDCQTGKYDLKCSKDCPDSCLNGCNLLNGNCKACNPKFYGMDCKKNCSIGCMNDGSCFQTNGSCTFSCYNMYVEDDCKRCPTHCLVDTLTCHPKTHHCIKGCDPGKYGPTCNGTCSRYCKYSDCDKLTGACRGGCQTGYHGPQCVEACCSNCLDSFCNFMTGHCLDCIPGKRGDRCELNCSAQCLDDKCDRLDGSCQAGCKPQYSGLHCDKLCQNCAGSGECSQQTMVCAQGCKPGFEGETCVIPSTPSATIPILLISTCLLSTMLSIIYLYWRRISKKSYSSE